MNVSTLFIRRPVATLVLAALILLVGAQGLFNLSVRQYPEVDETAITITTTYPGASASLIQGFISAPIAEAVATTEDIDYVSSESRPSTSVVTVKMQLGADPDVALTEVLAKAQEVTGDLPERSNDPIIVKGTGQTNAMMYLAVQHDDMSPEQLTEYIDRVIQPRMSTLDGVAEVQILGASEYAMRVWIDPTLLAARGLTATDVRDAIGRANLLAAPGDTENELVSYAIDVSSTLQTAEGFGAIAIAADGDEVVRLTDVARTELAAASDDTIVDFNGERGTFIGITRTPSANPLDTAAAVLEFLPELRSSLPDGMEVTLMYDATEAISASIDEVYKTIAEAVAIVTIVIWLFLGSFRSVLMPLVTIPLSLVGVCAMLWAFGFSINLLTLLAMVLAIGLVVDDAIVVVENVQRHVDDGMTPTQASFKGMREISGAVVGMTLTLVAVFAPLAFTGGLTGSLFREFALTLAGAVLISGVIALTVTPAMCARVLKKKGDGRLQRFVDERLGALERRYRTTLEATLPHRALTAGAVAVLAGLTGYLFVNTAGELAPEEDVGALFSQIQAPSYATTDYTKRYVDRMREATVDIDGGDLNFSITGTGGETDSGLMIWVLKSWDEREVAQSAVQGQIQQRIAPIDGVEAFVFAPPTLPGAGGGLPVSLVLQSAGPSDEVARVAEEVVAKAQASGQFITVQNSLSYDARQVTVTIDRDRAAALNLSVADVSDTLSLLVGEGTIGEFDRDENSYDIIMQVPAEYRANPEDLADYFVRSVTGDMVPLSAVIELSSGVTTTAIEQFNQLNAATLTALPVPGVTSGAGLDALEAIARETMPAGFLIDYKDQSRLEQQEGSSLLIAFGLAIVVIYLVLAAQFESLRDPLIILMAVPLSIFGAIVPLNLGLDTLNIYTQVGLVALVGLITKHGILIVEFANQHRTETGVGRDEGVAHAAAVRLRPILMTTASMVVAMVPLLIATGSGAAARFSMGLVIFAGMLVGTLFTLFVVPAFYSLVSARELAAEAEGPEPAQGKGTNDDPREPGSSGAGSDRPVLPAPA